jgi:dinuclear metal center YbgI/SA1388 family protein
MSVELSQLTAVFEQLWPLEGADEWDAPGLVSGSENQRVSRVLLSVDVTHEVLAEAQDGAFDLVFAHHPFLLKGVQSVAETNSKGALLASAIRSNIAIYAAHTNADIVEAGVSDVIAKSFGLQQVRPLIAGTNQLEGHGRIGNLASAVKLGDFAGDYDQKIQTVALCGGAGDSFISAAFEAGADVYVTSDLRHHPAQDAKELERLSSKPFSLIDVSHWASEWLWLEVAASQLSQRIPNVQFVVSHIRTDPWEFVVTQ